MLIEYLIRDAVLMYQYQAVEREQERDEYQAKITQLESLVKERDRKDGVTQRLTTEVCYIPLVYLPWLFFQHLCITPVFYAVLLQHCALFSILRCTELLIKHSGYC